MKELPSLYQHPDSEPSYHPPSAEMPQIPRSRKHRICFDPRVGAHGKFYTRKAGGAYGEYYPATKAARLEGERAMNTHTLAEDRGDLPALDRTNQDLDWQLQDLVHNPVHAIR